MNKYNKYVILKYYNYLLNNKYNSYFIIISYSSECFLLTFVDTNLK